MIQNKLPNLPSKSFSFTQNDNLRAKLRLSETKYRELQTQFSKNKQQLFQNQTTIKSLQNQIITLKQSLSKQQMFHVKTVEYLSEEIKVRCKAQKVWIDYLKRQNEFLKGRLKAKSSDSFIKDSDFQKINKNPINMLIWKIEQLSSERLSQQSKFKKLLIPFFSALYKSKTTDELFEECIILFRNCQEYETAISKGEKVRAIIEDFTKEAMEIFGDDQDLLDEMIEQMSAVI